MTKHGPIIEELERATMNVAELSMALIARQVRVSKHPAGGTPVDITDQYADGLRKASDALNKAVAALKNIDT
jgi:expansin (peptidoglycan-binding protein)